MIAKVQGQAKMNTDNDEAEEITDLSDFHLRNKSEHDKKVEDERTD